MKNNDVEEFVSLTKRSLVNVGLGLYPHYLSVKSSILHHKLSSSLVNTDNSVLFAFPREFGKSTYCWLLMAAWNIIHRKYSYIVFITDSISKGEKQFLTTRHDVLSHPLLKGMISEVVTDNKTFMHLRITCPLTGEIRNMYMAVYGSHQNLRGLRLDENRPDLIILDDVEDSEESRSEIQRAKMKEWFASDVQPLGKSARIFFVGTMVHEDCLFANLLADPPEDTNTGKRWDTFRFGVLDEKGDPTWKEKYDINWINTTRKNYIKMGQLYRFNTEYMNIAVGSDDRVFAPGNVRFFSDMQWKATANGGVDVITTVDLGIKTKMENDPTVIKTTAMDDKGNIWILGLVRERMRKTEILDSIYREYAKHNPRMTFIEAVQGQEYLVQDLEEGLWRGDHQMPFERIDSRQVAMGKEVRIGNLEDLFRQRKIFIPADAPWWDEFVNELVSFPRGRHDDMLDALSYAKMNHVKPLGSALTKAFLEQEALSSTVF